MIIAARGCAFNNLSKRKAANGEVMPYCIFHDDPKVTPVEKLRTDVCMVMPAAVTPKGNIGFKQLPAGRYAIFLYKGRTNTCKVCTTQSMENTSLKWNVHSEMKPVPNDT